MSESTCQTTAISSRPILGSRDHQAMRILLVHCDDTIILETFSRLGSPCEVLSFNRDELRWLIYAASLAEDILNGLEPSRGDGI